MLQHTAIDRVLMSRVLRTATDWATMAELERTADEAIGNLRRMREARAVDVSKVHDLAATFDAWLRTSEPEYLDDPDFPPERKKAIVQALHRFNQGVFAYRRFYRVLRPLIRQVAVERRTPVRILELASGSGEFSFALAALAKKDGIAVEITGSDYFREHVLAGNAKARTRGVDLSFIELNAFDMSALAPGDYDIVFIAQSIHHFSPGQVAMMVAQATRVASIGFVGIDGRRSMALFGIVPSMGLLFRSRDYLHDALVTLRKFYTETELELIARIAVPNGFVSVRPELPGYSVLTVCA
jgi:SAM-dependent methyltransferase